MTKIFRSAVIFEAEPSVQHAFWRGLENRLTHSLALGSKLRVSAEPITLESGQPECGKSRFKCIEGYNALAMAFPSDQWLSEASNFTEYGINLGHFSKITQAPTVAVDDYEIGCRAAAHFLKEEIEAVALIAGNGTYDQTLRRRGFLDGLARAGFPSNQIVDYTVSISTCGAAFERLAKMFPARIRLGLWLADSGLAERYHQWNSHNAPTQTRNSNWLSLECLNEYGRMEAEAGRRSGFIFPGEELGTVLVDSL